MITMTAWWLCARPVDMRKSIDSLMVYALEHHQHLTGQNAYIFCNRSGTRLKVLVQDSAGFWLCLRRLDRGRFTWPADEKVYALQAEQFAWLCAGLDWQKWDKTLPQPKWL
jgi:transposase